MIRIELITDDDGKTKLVTSEIDPKPGDDQPWTCVCGHVEEDVYCFKCGRDENGNS